MKPDEVTKVFPFLGNYMCPGSDAPLEAENVRYIPGTGAFWTWCRFCNRIRGIREGEMTVTHHRVNHQYLDATMMQRFQEEGLRI